MKRQTIYVLAGLLGLAPLLQGCGRAAAQEIRRDQPRDIQLTIYKEDFALVHEARPVDLNDGRTRLHLENVSKALDPGTVIFDWSGKKGPDVVSQMYDLGVANGASLLKRLEGKPVEMLWNSQDGKPHDRIEGTLEAAQDGGFVLRSGDKLYVNPSGTIVASGEASLVTMPQLSVEVDSPGKTSANLGFAYQTRGMSWSADYVGRLTPDGDAMDLECWATLENHTGIDYPNAKITLVAGSPNRAVVARAQFQGTAGVLLEDEAAKTRVTAGWSPMQSQAVGELYAYKVPAAASVGQEQMNRVKMLHSERVPVTKDYSIRLDPAGGYDYYGSNPRHQNAQLAISLVNDEQSGLGMPLPSGPVRLYDATSSDSTAFVGASGIGDTAKDQHVNMTLSKVFDVYSDSKAVKTQRIDKHTVRRTFQIVLHNEKKSAVDVRLVQAFYGNKHLVSETEKGKMIDSQTRQWTVHVDAGAQKTLTWVEDFSG